MGKTRTSGVTATVICDERSKGNRQGDETGEVALERGHQVLTTIIIRKTRIKPASESSGGEHREEECARKRESQYRI